MIAVGVESAFTRNVEIAQDQQSASASLVSLEKIAVHSIAQPIAVAMDLALVRQLVHAKQDSVDLSARRKFVLTSAVETAFASMDHAFATSDSMEPLV